MHHSRALIASVIDWLDKHSGASAATLTAALVAVTVFYAWQNRNMVEEMKKARDATVLPKLAPDFHRLGPTVMTIAIQNVGPGAALDVDVRILWKPLDTGEWPERRWRRNLLAPGERADFMPPGDTVADSLNWLPSSYASVHLRGTMRDAVGNQHEAWSPSTTWPSGANCCAAPASAGRNRTWSVGWPMRSTASSNDR